MPSFEELLNTAQQKYQELSSGDIPWIRIGTAVCGHAAGSDDVINALVAELENVDYKRI